MKERVVTPDYVVNLKTIPGLNSIKEDRGGASHRRADDARRDRRAPAVREKLLILSDAAGGSGIPTNP